MLRNLLLLLAIVYAIGVIAGIRIAPAMSEAAEVKYVETEGTLQAPEKGLGSNYVLKTKDGDVFALAFDDMHPKYPEIKKALPGLVDKKVVVTHREGHVGIGKTMILLSRDIKEKK